MSELRNESDERQRRIRTTVFKRDESMNELQSSKL